MFSNISNDRQAAFLLKCIVDIFMNIENKPIRRSPASKSNTTRTTPKSMDVKRSPSKRVDVYTRTDKLQMVTDLIHPCYVVSAYAIIVQRPGPKKLDAPLPEV